MVRYKLAKEISVNLTRYLCAHKGVYSNLPNVLTPVITLIYCLAY